MKFKTPKKTNKYQSSSKTPFAVVEAYNTIRTNMLFLLSQTKGKMFAVTSAMASEGKSTTVLNLAISFSQLGGKILLIDADLRKPSIHKKVHIANTKGLSNVLVGFCTFDEAVTTINENLDILTAGTRPPNPSEILASQNFEDLLEFAKERYDYVIIDTPPINLLSDALLIAPRTDGVVMVVKDHETYHLEFRNALSSIEFANIHLFGVVLNSMNEADQKRKYGKYRYRYRYRYNYYVYGNSPSNYVK